MVDKRYLERSYYLLKMLKKKNVYNKYPSFKCIGNFAKNKESLQGKTEGILNLSGKLAFNIWLSSAFANPSYQKKRP